MKCRGQTRPFTRTLSSIASGGGTAAANDEARYGVSPARITVPTSGACSFVVP